MSQPMRSCGVATLSTAAAVVVAGWLVPATVPAGPEFTDLLVSVCAAAGVLAVAWLWLSTLWVVVEVWRGRVGRTRVPRALPAGVRRVVLAACGVTLAGGLALPAQAASDPEVLAGLPLPDRTTTTTQWLGSLADASPSRGGGPSDDGAERATGPETGPRPTGAVVTPGDTLWELARDTLPVTASDAEVERRWREIYAANREVVGADPDLIRPGQRLVLPGTTHPTDQPHG